MKEKHIDEREAHANQG